MGLFQMQIKYLKGAVNLFLKSNPMVLCLQHLHDVSCVHVPQGAAKLSEFKVGGSQKDEHMTKHTINMTVKHHFFRMANFDLW